MSNVSVETNMLLRGYRLELEALGRARGTITLRLSHVRRCLEHIDKPVSEITRSDLIEWLAANDWAPAARASARASLQSFWQWLAVSDYCTNVALDIPRPRQPRAVPRPASDQDIRAALAAAREDIRIAIELMAVGGLRRAEVARVKCSDVTLSPPAIRVTGKGGHTRIVPLPAWLARSIQGRGVYLFPGDDDGHISPGWLGKLISRALPSGVTPHQLRHRYATTVYRQSHNLRAVQELLGHASVATTQIYVAVDTDSVAAAASSAWNLVA